VIFILDRNQELDFESDEKYGKNSSPNSKTRQISTNPHI